VALPFQPALGVPEARSKAITAMLWAFVIGCEPTNSTNGTRGVPTPKSVEATASDSAEGPLPSLVGEAVGVAAAGAAQLAANNAKTIAKIPIHLFTATAPLPQSSHPSTARVVRGLS
jgi:hypothetical protein